MTRRRTLLVGGISGLVAPAIVLFLLEVYGVWQITAGKVDVRLIFWPFSVMLPVGWCCTVRGVLITIAAVAYNCLFYMGIALLLRAAISVGFRRRRAQISDNCS